MTGGDSRLIGASSLHTDMDSWLRFIEEGKAATCGVSVFTSSSAIMTLLLY